MPEQLTKQDLENFLKQVNESEESDDTECREVIDKAASKIRACILFLADTIEDKTVIHEIEGYIDAIADAVKKAQEKLNPPKLIESLSKSFDEMADSYEDFGFGKLDPEIKIWTMANIQYLSATKLETINSFGKPTIIITPPGSFKSKVDAIDHNKQIEHQCWTYCDPSPSDPLWGGEQTWLEVSVVDGIEAMPEPTFIKDNFTVGDRMKIYENEFKKQKLNLMGLHAGAMLMMKSLKNGMPVDDLLKANTATYYKTKGLTYFSRIPSILWHSKNSHVTFSMQSAKTYGCSHLRCRPSLTLLSH